MNENVIENKKPLKDKLLELYKLNEGLMHSGVNGYFGELRRKAADDFSKLGFPGHDIEEWKTTDLSKVIALDYGFAVETPENIKDIDKLFTCEVPDMDTYLVTLLNGWFAYKNNPISVLPDGAIIGSFAQALIHYPEIIKQHFGKYALTSDSGLNAVNTAFAQDGMFIYVPDGVSVEKPVQIVSIVDSNDNIFIQPRNLVVMGKGSRLTLVHCDHSLRHKVSFINSVTEVFIDEGAELDHYKLQNKDEQSKLLTSIYFRQEEGSKLSSNTITLNGGLIRNNIKVELNGSNCEADLKGLYLADAQQHVDSNVFVDHIKPNSLSRQMYKGILDDSSRGIYNGRILVRKDAQKTLAYQNNKNILLSEKAIASAKPHLEIYADDVKCSHGATVGQLDSEALFYMRARGISPEIARTMLMYAFAVDVTGKITIPALRERIDHLIEKRLRGELSICDQCVLHCKDNNPVVFDIDMSKI